MTDTQPITDAKNWAENSVVRKDLPFGLTAINQKMLAWFFESAKPKNELLDPLFEGGTEKLKRRLCSLAATLTCVNNLQQSWKPDEKLGPWLGVKEIARVLLTNQGVPIVEARVVDDDREKAATWKEWRAVSNNEDLYYHANACVAEALGIPSLVVEGISFSDFLTHLKRGGCACLSVDNSFVRQEAGSANLEPGGHIVSVLGIRYNETGENEFEGEAIVYDPYPYVVPGDEALQFIPLAELESYVLKHSSQKVRGILFSQNKDELNRYKQFSSPGAVKSQKVIDEISGEIAALHQKT